MRAAARRSSTSFANASPGQLEARYNLASQYLEQDRLDDAIRLLEEAARLA
jgi:thioredoxin-like negative regulator of GroEL